MNPENQDFENLRRLLKLKRYEQPPPRYFNDFSSQVVNRIQAKHPEDRVTASEAISWEAPWLQRFLAIFERKPFVAGAFGAAVCALLIGGTVYSEYGGSPIESPEFVGVQPVASPVVVGATPVGPASLGDNYSSLHFAGSTNPVSIFDQIHAVNPGLTSGKFGQ